MPKILLPLLIFGLGLGGLSGGLSQAAPAERENSSSVKALGALEAITQLPERSLTLDLILTLASERSDSIKAIRAGESLILLPQLQAQAPLEPRAVLSAQLISDSTQPVNPFSPSRTESNQLSVGVFKATQTGSELGFELSQGFGDIGFPAGSPFSIDPYYESKASLSIRQSLGANRLGYGTRRQLRSAALQSRANQLQLEEALEQWVQGMAGIYYSAWLAQEQAKAALESLQRRQKLRRTVQVSFNRGTAEEADFLQVEAAVLTNENQNRQALKVLGDRWRDLVLTLKLPETWLQTDLLKIPLKLDNVLTKAEDLCSNSTPRRLSTRTQALLEQSAQLEWERARQGLQPQLELQGRYFLNAVEGERSESLNSLGQGQNTGWSLGLQLTIPFDLTVEKMQLAQAVSQRSRAEAESSQARIDEQVDWLNECANLQRLKSDRVNLEKSLRAQQRRVTLEDRRFQLGRTSVFSLIQAGDDLTQAELSMSSHEVEIRQSAWRILSLTAKIKGHLEGIVESQSAALQQGPLRGLL